ncbi:MAG TPA: hypothetical protein VMW08_15980 [Acidimicrobiales bacterium]|nr:hypothetical protein [Acidimicrobiales bacterium]
MASERYVVLGLARVRSEWFREVARWSTSASIAVDFVKTVSIEEVRARLASGRAFSALLVDGSLSGVDRDLVDRARDAGASVIVVTDGRANRDWTTVGVSQVLRPEFGRDDLQRALADHAAPIGRSDELPTPVVGTNVVPRFRGSLVAVTGSGGAGASTIAIATAQGLADATHLRNFVVLADLQLQADQAMLHDARDVVPGLLELVDAHRASHPTSAEVQRMAFAVLDRHYHLLLGLRRQRDWTALRPRAFEASLAGLLQSYRVVVADVGADLEGEAECGSIDVEERNLIARTTLPAADVVVVVGRPGMQGLHAHLRVVRELIDHGIAPERLVPVINAAPRQARTHAALTRSFADLISSSHLGLPIASPVFVPERRGVDDVLRDGVRLPDQITGPVAATVTAALERLHSTDAPAPNAGAPEPVAVEPGSLGSWHGDDEEASG